MERVKLKIKRLETIDSILEAYAKRKSAVMIKEALLREEKQKARVKELEMRMKEIEASWKNHTKELKIKSYDLAVETKSFEGKLSFCKKEVTSLHTTSEDLETLYSDHDALRKERVELLKKAVEKRSMFNELLTIGDYMTLGERKKLASDIDVERAKVKQLEQNRKEIEKGAYSIIKEGLRKKLASEVDVEDAKVKQLEQSRKLNEKVASLTSKEGLKKKLASDVDFEHAKSKQVEHNRNKIEKRAYLTSKEGLAKMFALNVDVEHAKAKQLEQNRKEIMHNFVEPGKDQFTGNVGQSLTLIPGLPGLPGLPMIMEEATPFNMVKDDKNANIQIGDMIVPLFPSPTFLAAQTKKHAASH